MHMGMSLSIRQIQRCRFCDQSVEKHDEQCPYARLNKLLDARRMEICRCPICPGEMEVNDDDFYECHKCHSVFTRGMVGPELESDTVYQVLDAAMETCRNMMKLAEKGQGKFKYQKFIDRIEAEIKVKKNEQSRKTRKRSR